MAAQSTMQRADQNVTDPQAQQSWGTHRIGEFRIRPIVKPRKTEWFEPVSPWDIIPPEEPNKILILSQIAKSKNKVKPLLTKPYNHKAFLPCCDITTFLLSGIIIIWRYLIHNKYFVIVQISLQTSIFSTNNIYRGLFNVRIRCIKHGTPTQYWLVLECSFLD